MAMSRSSRITLLLVIDLLFFFLEIIVGYGVGSLALIADSFHMLNDVMSLVVALYAIKLTNGNSTDPRYSYGWHRAEILAALVNGVFLLALCFSISMEAIGRFFTTPDVSNPKFVVIVGSLGLASNIVGLFLFHEHSHSHSHSHKPSTTSSSSSSVVHIATDSNIGSGSITPTQKQFIPTPQLRSQSRQVPHSPTESFSSLYGHPAATRASLVQTANDIASAQSPTSPPHRGSVSHTLLSLDSASSTAPLIPVLESPPVESLTENTPLLHNEDGHNHKHGNHAQGSMNMRAVVLHVVGDALGNVGVIATGLIIWLSTWEYKAYCDPVISLIITIIIFSNALPLVRSASFILLQGVPSTVSLEEVKDSILSVEGVLSLHELHVWQLSESKIVASVHVLASRNHDFMPVAVKIRKILHDLGIHSCTIQPEYYHSTVPRVPDEHLKNVDSPCLVLCPADEGCNPLENACCPPLPSDV
ncbi:cation efflux protein [Phlegmacium glaucopus]|nr:cation efflux protein [Phlegmacium glaucopus]